MTPRSVKHRIRLRKPWQRDDRGGRSGDDGASAANIGGRVTASHRVDVPDSESVVDSVGVSVVRCVIYRRQFHRPSGLEAGDRVLLEVGAVNGNLVEIRLNTFRISMEHDSDVVVTGASDAADRFLPNGRLTGYFHLDEHLANHNELEIELESKSDAPGPPRLIGDVNLVIVEFK